MAGMLINAVENRMVMGEYFPELTAFDRAAEMANGQNYVDFIAARGDEDTVLSHWLGVILPKASANDLWDSLEDYKREDICKRYVTKNLMNEFVDFVQ